MSAGGPVHPVAQVDVLCLRRGSSPGRGWRPRGPNGPGQACSVRYWCHHESTRFSPAGGGGAMRRRTLLRGALARASTPSLSAALHGKRWEDAGKVLERATAGKQVYAAVLHVVQWGESFTRHFGKAASGDAMFLLGSISNPI